MQQQQRQILEPADDSTAGAKLRNDLFVESVSHGCSVVSTVCHLSEPRRISTLRQAGPSANGVVGLLDPSDRITLDVSMRHLPPSPPRPEVRFVQDARPPNAQNEVMTTTH